MIVDSLWQYPVKGLGGTTIDEVSLIADAYFPGDRLYAIGNGHAKLADVAPGSWMKKAFFLQLMKFEELAALDCHFTGSNLTIRRNGSIVVTADMDTADGQDSINSFFALMFGDALAGSPEIRRITSGAFTDTNQPWISFGGTASLDAFAALTGTTADARRFRLNMIMKTREPFEEAALIGKKIAIGAAELEVVEPVGRCAAIDVDPDTAVRGPGYVGMMQTHFGHSDLGVFARVTRGGQIRPGDSVKVI